MIQIMLLITLSPFPTPELFANTCSDTHFNINREPHNCSCQRQRGLHYNCRVISDHIFQDINEVQEVGFVKVEENQIPVELFLGGDY